MNAETSGNLSKPSDPITLFVAMPYSDLGEFAKWRKVTDVRDFYELVRQSVERRIDRPVKLIIEKETPKPGLVIDSMFRAIHSADVFIADLTGSNANVFLELGIRYGVSKGVTILTTQEDRPPPFDLNAMRLVRYANGPTEKAEEAIASIVSGELDDSSKRGSPVLSLLDVEVVPRARWEIAASIRINALIDELRRIDDPDVRLKHVQEAVETDPLSRAARIELARVYRARLEFDQALRAADEGVRRFATLAEFHKERGLILDRMTAHGDNRLDDAIAAYRMALELDNTDPDLHGCLGGALRRKALTARDDARTDFFEDALGHYRASMRLARHSTYAGLNILRLLMIMSGSPKGLGGDIADYQQRMYHLCAFEVADSHILPNDDESRIQPGKERWWPLFDLADVLAFMNDRDQSLRTYRQAIEIIPTDKRADILVSPLRAWKELFAAGILDKQVCSNAEDILNLLESHVEGVR